MSSTALLREDSGKIGFLGEFQGILAYYSPKSLSEYMKGMAKLGRTRLGTEPCEFARVVAWKYQGALVRLEAMFIDSPPYVFKIATSKDEFEQIHRLNYETFVEEIPQHAANPAKRLVDRFHDENTYLICLRGDEVVGMLAVRGVRPFSLDYKVENLDSYLPPAQRLCEFRLLTIQRRYRGTRVLHGLMALAGRFSTLQDFDLAVISGSTRQLKLYRHLGFEPFGPLVGRPDAQFQPMYLSQAKPKRQQLATQETV